MFKYLNSKESLGEVDKKLVEKPDETWDTHMKNGQNDFFDWTDSALLEAIQLQESSIMVK